jgi:hypothetical protein
MKVLITSVALIMLFVSGVVRSPSFAQDRIAQAGMPGNMATLLCRQATSTEKPMATMGSETLVCKTLDKNKIMHIKKMLDAMPNGQPIWLQMLEMLPVGNGAGS